MDSFSTKWFLVYYFLIGMLTLGSGFYLIFRAEKVKMIVLMNAKHEEPPRTVIILLKYILLLTVPSFILSFLPFSWIHLLCTVWILVMIFMAGMKLVNWQVTCQLITLHKPDLERYIRYLGVIMVSQGMVMFLLDFLVIKNVTYFP